MFISKLNITPTKININIVFGYFTGSIVEKYLSISCLTKKTMSNAKVKLKMQVSSFTKTTNVFLKVQE